MHSDHNIPPMRRFFASASARYATITPQGIRLPCVTVPYNPLSATIVTYKPARTRYVAKQPLCRSLDGIRSLHTKSLCAICHDDRSCTPQIALDILYRSVSFRLMLAYTAARNFLDFTRTLPAPYQRIEGAPIQIKVRDRGRWGEPLFSIEEQ